MAGRRNQLGSSQLHLIPKINHLFSRSVPQVSLPRPGISTEQKAQQINQRRVYRRIVSGRKRKVLKRLFPNSMRAFEHEFGPVNHFAIFQLGDEF